MIEDIDVVPLGREADGDDGERGPASDAAVDDDSDWRSDFRSYLDDPA